MKGAGRTLVLLLVAVVILFGGLYWAGYEPSEVVQLIRERIGDAAQSTSRDSNSAPQAPSEDRPTRQSAAKDDPGGQAPLTEGPAGASTAQIPDAAQYGNDVQYFVRVYDTAPLGLRVREDPHIEEVNILGKTFDGALLSVVGGPEGGDGYEWLNISLEGWVAADWLRGMPAPGETVTVANTGTAGLRVRMQPVVGYNVLGKLYDGTTVRVIDGPIIGTGYEWWRVQLRGWSASSYLQRLSEGPPRPVMVVPLSISPEQNEYGVGDSLTASFTVRNDGDTDIVLDRLTVGGRLDGQCPAGICPDFTHRAATLAPGQSYTYDGTLVLDVPGGYRFFAAYYINTPDASEALLVDSNGWNTSIDVAPGLTHLDRVRNLAVLGESTHAAADEATLASNINRLLQREVTYPPYLRNPDSFASAVATVWVDVTSFVTRTHLVDKYDEFYQAGIDYSSLGFRSLKYARDALNRGDAESAQEHLDNYLDFDKLSYLSFTGAAQVFDGALQAGEILADGIRRGCKAAVKFGLSIVSPEAAAVVDYVYIAVDFAIDYWFLGDEQALKDAVVEAAVTALFSQIELSDLGGRTIADYRENRIGAVTFPMLRGLFGNEQVQFALSRMLKEGGTIAAGEMADQVAHEILSRLQED